MNEVSPERLNTLIDNTHKFANSLPQLVNGIAVITNWADQIDPDDEDAFPTKSSRKRATAQKAAYLGACYNVMTILEKSSAAMAAEWEREYREDPDDEDDE